MKIGIDLDDVVFEFIKTVIIYLENEIGIIIEFDDFISYKMKTFLDITDEKSKYIIRKIAEDGMMEKLEVCKGAVDSIFKLSENNDIYFITSRVYKHGTEEILKKIFSDIDYELFFSSNPYAGTKGKNKGIICSELKIDYMIEDSYEHSVHCVENGIDVLLLNKPWNINSGEHEKIKRVGSWSDILEELK